MNGPQVYEFDDVSFDTASLRIVKGGVPVEVEPKAVDLLRILIANRDRLVTKEELLDALWPDTFVTPNVLTRAVAQLRKGLGDDAREARYIETATKRGYRFIAVVAERPVSATPAALTPDPGSVPSPDSVTGQRPYAEPRPPARRAAPRSIARALPAVVIGLALLGGLALWRLGSGTATGPAGSGPAMPTVRRLLGSVTDSFLLPTLSPDGQRVAYVSDKTGSLELYVRTLDTSGRELAITNDGGQNTEPNWSPDGRWVAFHSRVRGGIWVVPSSGGVARQVVEFGAQPAWSPDSQWIAFSSYEGAMSAQSSLWQVRADGSERRQLTALGMPPGGHQTPAWSPDGKRLVFVNFAVDSGPSLWTVARSGDAPQRLFHLAAAGNPQGSLGSPQVGPDGRAVYFFGTSAGGNGRLFRLPIDPATFSPAGAPVPLLPVGDELPSGLAVARNGLVVYGLVEEDSNLWAVDWPVAGSPRRLTAGRRNFRPSYAPDGRRMAYVNWDVGSGLTVWMTTEGESGAEPLLPGRKGSNPQWTSRGTVLIRNEPAADATFSAVAVDTRRVTPVAFDGRDVGEVSLSPDGAVMAFHQVGKDGALNVWTQVLATGARRQLTFDREAISYPVWSPDGRSIAAEVKRGMQTHVVVLSAATGAWRQLTDAPGQSWPNAWSPDGEWIAFAGERRSVWNLWAVSARTGETRQLTSYAAADGYVRWPAWSPQGNRIVFERNQRRGSIWMSDLR